MHEDTDKDSPSDQGRSFVVRSPYSPAGDQPAAIEGLSEALGNGERFVTVCGITGSGKSATMAWTIERLQRPALVIAPNKALAAQLAGELRELLPENKVCYFVSYYDAYTPESYLPASDTFIEKSASVNAEIDRLRHDTTAALLFRRDVVVVASVSCLYGLGAPAEYAQRVVAVAKDTALDRVELTKRLVRIGYERNDVEVTRGRFAVRGDTFEVAPAGEDVIWRISMFGDEVEWIRAWDPIAGQYGNEVEELYLWPATHYLIESERLEAALAGIEAELEERLGELREQEHLLEAQRLEQRVRADVEFLREMGTCAGVENYSRWLDGREAGSTPWTLVDYLADDALVFIDESHVAVPQIQGAWRGDRSRKDTLVEHGFRLPSARDNRPLTWPEFLERVSQVVFVSATPGALERELADETVEMVVRPTGLVDPSIEVHSPVGQLDDLCERIGEVKGRGERVLVTTATKKQAEDLVEYLAAKMVAARYLHSDVDTLERIELMRDLRLGRFDVLVGVNLLREGLDMPEVSLVAILDADKEGFLRSETALIQMIGRAARNVNGHVVMYAVRTTPAMAAAIAETDRRRQKQLAYNQEHGITPTTVVTPVRDLLAQHGVGRSGKRRQAAAVRVEIDPGLARASREELAQRAEELEAAMLAAAEVLEFERAASLRDELEAVLDLARGHSNDLAS